MTQAPPSSLRTENRIPDCALMKLHIKPIPAPTPPLGFQLAEYEVASPVYEIELKLTIRFNKATIQCPGGSVEFGLKRGVLTLEIENGKMPLEKVSLKAEFAKTLEVEEQQEKGRESEATIAVAAGVKTKDADKFASKNKHVVYQVTNRGTEECPTWEFQAWDRHEPPILLGQLTEEALGTVEATDSSCFLTATLFARKQTDVHLLDSSGIIAARNLSRNKTALATREFFLRFVAPKLQPYLSRVKGQL